MPSDIAGILKFGELGIIALALLGAYHLLRALPIEMGSAIGKAIAESELRMTDRLNDLETALRGNCRYGHSRPPSRPDEDDTPPAVTIARSGRLPTLDPSPGRYGTGQRQR